MKLEIIGYNDINKKNIILNYNSNIGILFTSKSEYEYPLFDKYKSTKKLENIIHFRSEYNIILETPILIETQLDDIFIDINIIHKNQKFKLNNNKSYDLRLNKISRESHYTFSFECINSLNCYYNNCTCLFCKEQLNKLKKESTILDDYYYGLSLSNYKLYNFIDNIFKLYRHQKKSFNYENILFNKPDKQLKLVQLNILDLSYIFNNNIIEEIKNIDKNKKNNNLKNTEHNYIYLIQKYDVNLKKDLYKFGKTNRHFNERIKEHGLEAKVLIILDVENCNIIETNILKVLRSDTQINERKDIGKEYFYCDNKQHIINIILRNIHL